MGNFLQDARHGFRMVVKNPLLSLGAMIVLGFGIAGNAGQDSSWCYKP